MKKHLFKNATTGGATHSQASDDDREMQVIVKGLEGPQEEEDVIQQVDGVIKGLRAENTCDKPFVFINPSKIGVIQFKTKASKIGFFKKTNQNDITWNNGKPMIFKHNDTIEKRINDKKLGLIKYHLINTANHQEADVKIKWRKSTVEIKHKAVAKAISGEDIEYEAEAVGIKQSVEEGLIKWKEKRGIE